MHQDTTWYVGRPRPRRHCVRWGPNSPSPNGAQSPQLLANVHCGQTAGWIKMPLGTKLKLGPGDVVLDGVAAPPTPVKGAQPPVFGPCLLWPNGWMDEDDTWYGSRPRPRRHCVRQGPTHPCKRGTAALPFSAHVCCCHGRSNDAHLSYC